MNILITGAWNFATKYIIDIEALGHNVIYMKNETDELPCEYEWVEGIICNSIFLFHRIDKFINLKYVQLISSGYDRVQMDYIKEKNIIINNANSVYSIPISEVVVLGVLQLYKKSKFFYENQKKHIWKKNRELLELYGKTICVIGCGSVGVECAKRFLSFGCKVIGVANKIINNQNFHFIYQFNDIKTAISISDVIVISVPLNEQTNNLFNYDLFNYFKSNSILVNVSRGAIVNTNALIDALSKKLYGAILDVFEEEPLDSNSILWDMDNVIIFPHNSFIGEGNEKRLYDVIITNLRNLQMNF